MQPADDAAKAACAVSITDDIARSAALVFLNSLSSTSLSGFCPVPIDEKNETSA
jgi:hypothetical protein